MYNEGKERTGRGISNEKNSSVVDCGGFDRGGHSLWERGESRSSKRIRVRSEIVLRIVVSLGTDTIEVDIAEYITDEDTERMRELDLTEGDMPDGYYIYNPDETTETLQLTKETNYTFIDWGRDFVDADLYEDLLISTTSRELFRSYLKTYRDSRPGMPFFLEVEDGTVKSILEKPFM